jgi:hypothetical protein
MEIKINENTTTSVQATLVPSSPPVPTANPADRIPENWEVVPGSADGLFVYDNRLTGTHFEGTKREFMAKFLGK